MTDMQSFQTVVHWCNSFFIGMVLGLILTFVFVRDMRKQVILGVGICLGSIIGLTLVEYLFIYLHSPQ